MVRLALQVLVLLAVSAGLALAANYWRADRLELHTDPARYRYQDVRFIAVEDAALLQEDAMTLFLDTRERQAYERRHVFGAVSFPGDAIETAYEELRDFLVSDMTLVIYSDDLLVSVRTARFLSERGFDAAVLDGGWNAWRDARLPVE